MLTGTCLCKSGSISIDGDLEHQPEACHCQMCRKQTGGFLIAVNVRKSQLQTEGKEHISWYRSSETVERGFCSVCGSTLFWKPEIDGYEWVGVAVGVIDQPIDSTIAKHTFVSAKGTYYEIADGIPQHEQH